MKYVFLFLLSFLFNDLAAQFYHIDIFNQINGKQLEFFRPLSNHTAFVSFYGEEGLYIFDGKQVFPVDTSIVPYQDIHTIGQEFAGKCNVIFENARQKSTFTYTIQSKKWETKKAVAIDGKVFFSETGEPCFWRNDSLFVIKKNTFEFVIKGKKGERIWLGQNCIFRIKKNGKNLERLSYNDDISTYPLPPKISRRIVFQYDDFLVIGNSKAFYQLDLETPNAVWKLIYRSDNNLSNFGFNKERKELLFIESFPKIINQYKVASLDLKTLKVEKYPYRWTEAPVNREGIQRDELGRFWIVTSTALLRLNPFVTALEPEKDNYPGNVWTTATATNGQTVLAAYQSNQPLAIYDKGDIRLDYSYINEIRKKIKKPAATVKPFLSMKAYKQNLLIPLEMPAGILEYHTTKGFVDFYQMGNPTFITYQSPNSGCWFFGQTMNTILRTKTATVGTGYDTLKLGRERKDLNTLGLCEDNFERLWTVGKGFYVFDKNSKTQTATYFKEDGFMSVCTDKKNGLWIGGTSTDKLLWTRLNENELPKAADFKQFDFKKIASLKIVQDTFLFIGGTERIGILHLPTFYKNKKFQPRILLNNDGNPLVRIEQNCFNIDAEGWLWITDTRGYILRIDPTEAWRTAVGASSPPKAFFMKATYNNTAHYLHEKNRIDLNENANRSILFTVSVTENIGLVYNIRYNFQLKKGANLLIDTIVANPTFLFNGSEYGDYTVSVAAVLPNGVVGEFEKIDLMLEGQFWEKYWKQLYFLGFVLVSVVGVLVYQSKKKDKEIKATKAENDAWFTAMFNGQMNIHFLGNAIETIKSLIKSEPNGIEIFTTALYKLSLNIWTVAECARQGSVSHSLAKELELIKNNLWIYEKIYPEDFKNYHLPNEAEISHLLDVQVPLQSILVHTDNAVEHGIKYLEEAYEGQIWVEILEEADYLIVKVKDNGVGRKRAKKIGSKGNQKAENLQNKLAERFNAKNDLSIKRVHQFLDNEKETGNITLIYIPKKYNYGYQN